MSRAHLIAIASALLALPAWAVPTVDGTKDAEYGAALAVQTVETGFTDNASEMDAAYATCSGTKLYLMLTGNVEANFNKLEIFIDSKAGGQAIFDSSGNDGAAAMDGLEFDPPLAADYHVIVGRGTDMDGPRFDLDFADLTAQTSSGYSDILGGLDGSGATGTGVNATAIDVGYDNANMAGVLGGMAAANQAAAAAVTTGLELGITLSDLGYVGGPIRIMVGQNNQNHNYWSNQFLAGLPAPQGNVGGDEMGGFTGEGAIDLTNFAGNQFFVVTCGDSNDTCEEASELMVPSGGMTAVNGSTTGASFDGPVVCGTGITAPGVWYSVTGTGNTMTASTCAANGGTASYDTKISVFCSGCPGTVSDCCTSHATTGCDDATCQAAICGADPFCCNTNWDGLCVAAALATCSVCAGSDSTCVAGNDDACEFFHSTVSWCSTAATEYLILVHGFGLATGDFTLAVSDNETVCMDAVECAADDPNGPCPEGSFSATGQEPCTSCPEGSAQPAPGQTACVPCAPGTVQPLRGQEACEECLTGTFQPDSGATECLACAPGELALPGAASCNTTVPVTSLLGLCFSVLVLIGVGVFGLRR